MVTLRFQKLSMPTEVGLEVDIVTCPFERKAVYAIVNHDITLNAAFQKLVTTIISETDL